MAVIRQSLSTHFRVRSVLLECRNCGHQTSVTAGTIFQDTRKPLIDWFRAMYWVTTQKNGARALGLQTVLGLGSYKTAWTWLHNLRRAMVRLGRDRLSVGSKWTRRIWEAWRRVLAGARQTVRR